MSKRGERGTVMLFEYKIKRMKGEEVGRVCANVLTIFYQQATQR
jgi:hypothetical protein